MPLVISYPLISAVLQNSIGLAWTIGTLDGGDNGELSSDEVISDDEVTKGMLKTLSGDNIDKVPPKLNPQFSKSVKRVKPATPKKVLSSFPFHFLIFISFPAPRGRGVRQRRASEAKWH